LSDENNKNFPVVGIGASAGGVEALGGFFRQMPSDTGMAFVLVMHMPIAHGTMLPEILRRQTSMPVTAVKDGEQLVPDHVYVCPAGEIVTTSGNTLRLERRTSPLQTKPIDVFLASLAKTRGDDAVGVILSGAGSDGALGLKAIKERGGLTLAQGSDGTGPKQKSMPDTAVATGVVDLILPVEQMADRLLEFATSSRELDRLGDVPAGEAEEDARGARIEICRILLQQVGHDFSGYKEKTFLRRTRRRMQVVQVETLRSYLEFLRKNPDEVSLLFRDLLIGVTNFFRDKDAFEALEQMVVPKLFEGLGVGDTVRIWVPGCSTGEEVYSLAILMRERLAAMRNAPKVQLFATDIDEAALAVARLGRYPEALLDSITPERLKRFFTKEDASYVIAKEIRDLCIFSAHSVVRDPPFSRIDLISCRNLLIYLGTEFQSRVIPVFHFALRPGGYLFLGTSENIGQHSELFQRIDRKQRLFQRRDHVSVPLQFPLFGAMRAARQGAGSAASKEPGPQTAADLRHVAEARVLDRFAPAHVVVDQDGEVIYYSARTGKYLEPAAGLPSRQLVAMARRGLRPELRAALQQAMETRRAASRERVLIEFDDRVQAVDVTVEPLGNHDTDPLFLVLFVDLGAPVPSREAHHIARGDAPFEQVERELRDTRERLQAMSEEYETAVEELKASNEEMVSVNEELQSTNEELETSKEELQSVNEELQTVNVELNGKIEELDLANADLRNLFESTRIATLFVDGDLIIRSFTPAVTAIFNLISTDRGRPLSDLVSLFDLGDLKRDVRLVVESGNPVERNVRRADESAHYLMRILPYRARRGVIEGAIVTFVDVTKIVAAEAQQRKLLAELNHRVKDMLGAISSITQEAMKRAVSPEEFGNSVLRRIEALTKSYDLLVAKSWSGVQLADLLQVALGAYDGRRVIMSGPAVALRTSTALSLGLAFHELAVNAAKFGALSNGGKLTVKWRLEGDKGRETGATIEWIESGGPAARKPPADGLGSELVEREITQVLKGSIERDYASGGFRAEVRIPLAPFA
jgi:two-component system CheB/CheR fusion protein